MSWCTPQEMAAKLYDKGIYVTIQDTVRSFKAVLSGQYDHLPEGAFYTFASCEGVLGRTTPGGMLLRTDADSGPAPDATSAALLRSGWLRMGG